MEKSLLNVVKVLGFALFPLARARALDKSLLFFTVTSVTLLWQGVDFQMVKIVFSKCYGFNARNVEDGARRGLWSVRFLPTFRGECPTFSQKCPLFSGKCPTFYGEYPTLYGGCPTFCRKSELTSTKGGVVGMKKGVTANEGWILWIKNEGNEWKTNDLGREYVTDVTAKNHNISG